ncbi:MAG: YfhO family protein [Prevotella sp.]|nr:YfhO family protein [Prevotella sp.]
MEKLKKCLPDILAVVLFAVIAFAYFFPADFEGRILYQHDTSAGRGAGQEAREYFESTGERTRWTNATFSGMPTYQTAPSYDSTDVLSHAVDAWHLWLPDNVWYVFAYLLGFYLLLRAFNFRQTLAVLGAIVWAFSSYFFIIIAAGHIWKVWALAYLPPMIAGVILAYRGKYFWGFVVTALFAAFEVNANHVQMTYYYLFIIFFMILAFLIQAIRERQMARFFKASAVCVVAAAIGICANLSNLYHTWQYQKESMRGKSELVKANSANQTDSGLERDYITQWSYGIDETWTLLVPNVKGGASVPLAANQSAMEKADPTYYQIYGQIGQYWGEQPGTSGPVYVGAFVLMLFVLGLFVVKGPMKWALLAATILSILLSWGHNFMGLTDFFIDHFPMYSKFRTVASILVIAEFTIPLLAMMALKKVIEEPKVALEKIKIGGATIPVNPLVLSWCLTGLIALLFAVMPGVFFSDFVSSSEMQALSQFPADQLNPLLSNLRSVRESILTADAWRSFFVILVGTLLLVLFLTKKMKASYMVAGVTLLCLTDMWMVNKRYLNDDMFVSKMVKEMPQEKTSTDEQILQDKALDYRVLNFASNTFNENETSFYHKSVGGYHAAKLRRYQEMIEAYIAPEMQKAMQAVVSANGDFTQIAGDSIFPVINMLNTKYFILPLQGGATAPLQNPFAQGNAWLVDRVNYVDNANAEIDGVGKTDLRHEAVADVQFKDILGESTAQDSTTHVSITAYQPNNLKYTVESSKGGVVVFSEIYYPGWTATVDGQPAEIGRVNYILRALKVEPGKHEVVLDFHPKSVATTETVAHISLALLFLSIIAGLVFQLRKKTKPTEKMRK